MGWFNKKEEQKKSIKTIQSKDKEEFDRVINEYLEKGWDLVENTYSVLGDGQYSQLISFQDKIESIDEVYFEEKLNQKVRMVGSLKNGLKTGLWIFYYENGNEWRNEEYRDGKRDGKFLTYWENGKRRGDSKYKNDNFDGIFILYHENGNKHIETNYKDGKIEGLYCGYNEKGQKIENFNYISNKREGNYTIYHENGNLRHVGNYRNDEIHGKLYQYYRSNEQLMLEINYTDGKIDDQEVTVYHKSGCILYKELYKNEKVVNRIVHYFDEEFEEDKLLFGNKLIME